MLLQREVSFRKRKVENNWEKYRDEPEEDSFETVSAGADFQELLQKAGQLER